MNTATLPQLPAAAYTPLGSEVYQGLTSRPKTLCPWLFYDAPGSQLFEEITELEEYYVTRTERSIFLKHAQEILRAAAAENESSQSLSEMPWSETPSAVMPLSVIELGAGTATKTGILLSAAVRQQGQVVYHAIDVSGSALEAAKQNLEEKIPGVTVETRTGDYTEGLGAIVAGETRRLVLYIGSSIGNFDPAAAMDILRGVRAQITAGDRLLLGVDMVKDLPTLLAAYDDAKGVTAAFNRNVLLRINASATRCAGMASFRVSRCTSKA
jgi:L-histidine N-alpha-methyltransferase